MIFDVITSSSSESSIFSENEFINKLIPSWTSFVTQLAAFIILIIVVICLAYKPVKKLIKKRQDFIDNEVNEAKSQNELAAKNNTASQALLETSRKDANQIIIDAKAQAKLEQEKILNETAVLVNKMKLDAEQEIAQSKIDAEEEIRKEMISLAIDASSEILKREVKSSDNAKIADDFIKGMK